MLPPSFILALCKPRSLARMVTRIMGLGLLLLTDTFLTMLVATWTGAYLALAASAAASWLLVLFISGSLGRHTRKLRSLAKEARNSAGEYRHLAGLALALVLAMIPGFFTDILALAFYVMPLRLVAGRTMVRKDPEVWEEVAQVLSSD